MITAPLLGLLLAASVLSVYAPVRGFDFLNLDDPRFVSENEVVLQGLTLDGIRRAFAGIVEDYWIPLVWLSYMTDVELFGTEPGGFHLTNLLLHTANVLLLFGVLVRMTGALFRSALVAALFGLHPLHVEAVAWVTARKDVLSTLFLLLSLHTHQRFVRTGNRRWCLWLFICFALGLMAKPMLVTLPLLLLLLDWWPLGRWATPGATRRLLVEKVPLFLLSAAFSLATMMVRRYDLTSTSYMEPLLRLALASTSPVLYLRKTFWPLDLHLGGMEGTLPTRLEGLLAMLSLAAVSGVAIVLARRLPTVAAGWFFYLCALLPVSGIQPTGNQWISDRFAYVPLIGVYLLLAWGVTSFVPRPRRRHAIACGLIVVLGVLPPITRAQLNFWRDTDFLFRHTIAVKPEDVLALSLLGDARRKAGDHQQALQYLHQARNLAPDSSRLNAELGLALGEMGRIEEGIPYLALAVERDPRNWDAHFNLGVALSLRGRREEAVWHFEEALRLRPDDREARFNLGQVLLDLGRLQEAEAQLRYLAWSDPESPRVQEALARIRRQR